MQEIQKTRMPTGIASLDPILDSGMPLGKVILLVGEIGAGYYEYAYSSTMNLLGCMKRPKDSEIQFAVRKSTNGGFEVNNIGGVI